MSIGIMARRTLEILRNYKKRYLQNIAYGLFVVFAVIITYDYGFSPYRGCGERAPNAIAGELIITQGDIENTDLFQLEGEFSFYWKKLYTLNDIDAITDTPVYVNVPSVWNDKSVYSEMVNSQGFATYHLIVRVPIDAMYGIKVKELDCAYNLMVNGESIHVGKVGVNKESTVPSWKRQEIFFHSQNKKVDIVLQIANFHHRKGGPEDVMLFGTAKNIRIYKMRQMALSVFLLGVFFALAGYFFHIYVVGRRDSSIILFSILSFFVILRLATTGEKLLFLLFPNLSWDIAMRIEYLAFIVTTGLFLSFLRSFYAQIFTKGLERFVWLIIIVSCLPVLFMSPLIFSYIPVYYQVFAFIVSSYMLYGIFVALINKLVFSGVFFVGILFFYATLVNDLLYFNKIVSSGYLLPYGLFFLFFSFSFIMAKKLTDAFLHIDMLSSALKKQTKHLECEVKKRTKEISFQKDSIEKQALNLEKANDKLLELNRFRDDMTGMIVHDLKNPLNSIINLAQMDDVPDKDKLIWQAGIEMHNMVLNILDVNKAEEVGFTINMEPINLNDIVTTAIHDVSINTMLKGIRVERTETSKFNILGDAEILNRVLVNILINAIRFSPTNGGIQIVLDYEEDNLVICKIKDQGPGIKRDMQQRIFDMYRSGEQSDQSMRSTGLGLAFCKIAIEAHGGCINVSSVWGEGSEFQIQLPLESFSLVEHIEFAKMKDDVVQLENISAESKRIIEPYLTQLKQKEVFEVTYITNVLEQIMKLYLDESEFVVASINEALLSCNQEKYSDVINRLIR